MADHDDSDWITFHSDDPNEPWMPEPGPEYVGGLFTDTNGVVWECIWIDDKPEGWWGWQMVGE